MKTPQHLKLVAAAIVSLSAAVVAHGQGRAQGFRVGGESPNDPTYLLSSESVQKELALANDQKSRLQKLRDADENGGHAFFGGLRGLSQDEIQAKLEKHAKETRQQISKVLTPQQTDRLNEIYIQAVGVAALSFDDVSEKIGLTADQKKKLKDLGDETRRQLSDLNPTNNGQPRGDLKPQDRKQKLSEITADRKAKAIALLTGEQKTKFEELEGKKFDTSTIQPNRRSFSRRGRIEAPRAAPPL